MTADSVCVRNLIPGTVDLTLNNVLFWIVQNASVACSSRLFNANEIIIRPVMRITRTK